MARPPPQQSPGHFLNHSCNPNSGLNFENDKFGVIAMRNIKSGEEITIDYSTTEIDPKWKMNCMCKNQNCRNIISSYQFLPENLKHKYLDFVPKNFLSK